MIVAHHFIVHNSIDIASMDFSAKRVAFEVFFAGVGKIGVVCFFTLSAWFLCNRNDSLKDSIKRVWTLECELLFWSVAIYIVTRIFFPQLIPDGYEWDILRPITTGCWWYATFYAGFLLLLPFLQMALRSLTKEALP